LAEFGVSSVLPALLFAEAVEAEEEEWYQDLDPAQVIALAPIPA
jgi:hypothetical protein